MVEYTLYMIITRPTGSTLFPYTTLFRSARAVQAQPITFGERHVASAHRLGAVVDHELAASGDAWLAPTARDEDRKSTRLNSSHPSISYAVFCLKKKILS